MARLEHPGRARRPLAQVVLLVALCFFLLNTQRTLKEHGRMLRHLVVATAAQRQARAGGGGNGASASGEAASGQQKRGQQEHEQQPTLKAGVKQALKPIPPVWDRYKLIELLQEEGHTTGAELGVLVGEYAERVLQTWKSCTKYYLVDLWDKQENYEDTVNRGDSAAQEARYQETKKRLEPWKDKTHFLRMLTTEAAKQVPDGSLDFVYIDARHDYCGVSDDMLAWWPKMRRGGIFAGHDYLPANHGLVLDQGQDWSLCQNGTVNEGAVKGAVDDFAAARGLAVTATGDGGWATWMIRVP